MTDTETTRMTRGEAIDAGHRALEASREAVRYARRFQHEETSFGQIAQAKATEALACFTYANGELEASKPRYPKSR
jgi:hypothetical protein